MRLSRVNTWQYKNMKTLHPPTPRPPLLPLPPSLQRPRNFWIVPHYFLLPHLLMGVRLNGFQFCSRRDEGDLNNKGPRFGYIYSIETTSFIFQFCVIYFFHFDILLCLAPTKFQVHQSEILITKCTFLFLFYFNTMTG